MLRGLVTFLVSLQLLMPPGLCICQFAPHANEVNIANFRVGPIADQHTDEAVRSCCCTACLSHGTSDRGTARSELPQKPFQEEQNAPKPANHFPGCPAELGDMPTKLAVSVVILELDDFEGVFSVDWSNANNPVGREKARLDFTPHSPPLFISHCTLVI